MVRLSGLSFAFFLIVTFAFAFAIFWFLNGKPYQAWSPRVSTRQILDPCKGFLNTDRIRISFYESGALKNCLHLKKIQILDRIEMPPSSSPSLLEPPPIG
jgi:hypothetical protein